MAVVFFAGIVGLALAYGSGRAVNLWEISSARAYVDRAVPLLEAAKSREGAYPAKLPVAQLGAPPFLLRSDEGYTSNGQTFSFAYTDPAGLMDGYIYTNSTHVWEHGD